MKDDGYKESQKNKKTDIDPDPSFLCFFVLFVAQKLSSVKNFAPFKEIERSLYKRLLRWELSSDG